MSGTEPTGFVDMQGSPIMRADILSVGLEDDDMYTTYYEWIVRYCTGHGIWELGNEDWHQRLEDWTDGDNEVRGLIVKEPI